MNKKRIDRCSWQSKSWQDKQAQVTIFMIIGLLLLFAFIFLLLVSKSLQLGQLEEEKEGVLSKALQKEGLRIYVEDCLRDSLTQGLQLIGQQGRLWNDQSGGRKRFEQGKTGVQIVNGIRVFYALTNKTYNQHQDESYYPCSDGQNGICTYHFPNTTIGFGTIEWLSSTITADVERYVIAETLACVEQEVRNDISQQINIEAEENIELDLRLEDDMILANVYYPLRLVLGEEELFSLTTFDFSYRSKFKQLLDVAVSFPLQQDQQFVDFNFDEATLLSDTFTYGCEQSISSSGNSVCSRNLPSQRYKELSLEMKKYPWPETGDDIIEFTVPEGVIVETPGEYLFRIARQNRPPALDYVAQCPSEDYDYLVVKGVQGNLGLVNFTITANDPDEEANVLVRTESVELTDADLINVFHFAADPNQLNPREQPYIVTAIAEDDHLLTDWQQVRIKVQEQLNPMLEFINLADNRNTLSLEDPVCLVVNDGLPNLQFSLNGLNPPVADRSLCAPLANFDILTHDNNNLLAGQNTFRITGPSQSFGDAPECTYNLDLTQTALVQECTPLNNANYPYPYIDSTNSNLNTLYQFDSAGNRNSSRNPFQATRACCAADGTVSSGSCTFPTDRGCFTTAFYLEQVSGTCQGRGNVCSDPVTTAVNSGKNTCGDKNKPYCSDAINNACQNVEAGAFNSNGNWCYGNNGCENVCILGKDAIINRFVTQNDDPGLRRLNPPYLGNNFECGCNRNNRGFVCDDNYDGKFNGVCAGTAFITCEGDVP